MRNHDRLPTPNDLRNAFRSARDSYLHDYCYSGDIRGSTSTILIKSALSSSTIQKPKRIDYREHWRQ